MRNLDIKTKYFDQDSYQIPKLENTWGALIDVLDYTLVVGSPSQDVLSIVSYEDPEYPEDYWMADLRLNLNHGLKEQLSVISLFGCVVNEFNSTFRVQKVVGDLITIAFNKKVNPTQPGVVPGTLGVTLKMEPMGYTKPFEGPQKGVYKTSGEDGKSCFLRVDNSCPAEHNPSYAKFARVSMLTDCQHIDDYKYRLDRKKAPAHYSNYNKAEESIFNIWFTAVQRSNDYITYNNTNFKAISKYSFIGDSEFFIYHIKELREYGTSDFQDKSYIFGRYTKHMYQEDPWPYILKVSEKYSETSNYFEHENSFTNLVKDSTDTNGNFTFSTENINLFSSDTHDKWNIWFEDSYTSGSDSKISYKPYKNDLNLNLIDAHLKMKRVGDNTVLEGVLRGIKLIMSNIRDNEDMAPQLYKPFKYRGKDFIRIPDGYDRGAAAITSSYVISLNNWDIL